MCRCGSDLSVLWSREVSHVPFAAAPLLADIKANGRVDIVVALFTGEIRALHEEARQLAEALGWPHKTHLSTVHATSLQVQNAYMVQVRSHQMVVWTCNAVGIRLHAG